MLLGEIRVMSTIAQTPHRTSWRRLRHGVMILTECHHHARRPFRFGLERSVRLRHGGRGLRTHVLMTGLDRSDTYTVPFSDALGLLAYTTKSGRNGMRPGRVP